MVSDMKPSDPDDKTNVTSESPSGTDSTDWLDETLTLHTKPIWEDSHEKAKQAILSKLTELEQEAVQGALATQSASKTASGKQVANLGEYINDILLMVWRDADMSPITHVNNKVICHTATEMILARVRDTNMIDWKLFNDTFEAEINAQEFAIDEAEWAGLLKALKKAEDAVSDLVSNNLEADDNSSNPQSKLEEKG